MQYTAEFRNKDEALALADRIRAEVDPARQYRYMEFCGGHTHVLARWGLTDLLPANIRMIHGPGNKGNLNLLYKIVAKGIPWPLGAFENRRTFTSVGNICFVVRELLIGDARSGIYNMGDDDSLSTNELIRLICSVLGKKARVWNISPALMEAFARVGGCLGLPLNPERMRKLTESYVASNEKIKKAIGVERFPVSAEEGLRTTIECFKDA